MRVHTEIPGGECHRHRNWALEFLQDGLCVAVKDDRLGDANGYAGTVGMTLLHMCKGCPVSRRRADDCDIIR